MNASIGNYVLRILVLFIVNALLCVSDDACWGGSAMSLFDIMYRPTDACIVNGKFAVVSAMGNVVVLEELMATISTNFLVNEAPISGMSYWKERSIIVLIRRVIPSEILFVELSNGTIQHRLSMDNVGETEYFIGGSCSMVNSSRDTLSLLISSPSECFIYFMGIYFNSYPVITTHRVVFRSDTICSNEGIAFAPPNNVIIAQSIPEGSQLYSLHDVGNKYEVKSSTMLTYNVFSLVFVQGTYGQTYLVTIQMYRQYTFHEKRCFGGFVPYSLDYTGSIIFTNDASCENNVILWILFVLLCWLGTQTIN